MYHILHLHQEKLLILICLIFSSIIITIVHSWPGIKSQTISRTDSADPFLLEAQSMSLDQKIRQLLVCSYPGKNIKNALAKINYCGNFILMGDNVKDLTTEDIRKNNNLIHEYDPLSWIMIDEEGGNVSRLANDAPPANIVGQTNTADYWGDREGKILKTLMIDVNLAPVSDIGSESPAIGNRSFGDNPTDVTKAVTEYLPALQKNEVVGVIKHLPGHGRVMSDTHKKTGTLSYGWSEIQNYELVPVVNAIDSGAQILMLGHIIIPGIERKPASTSSKVIEMLRDFLPRGDELIFMTDSLIMKGVGLPPLEASMEALKAGEDMLLIPNVSEDEIFTRIKDSYNNGTLDISKLDTTVSRILRVKHLFGKKIKTPLFKGVISILDNTPVLILSSRSLLLPTSP